MQMLYIIFLKQVNMKEYTYIVINKKNLSNFSYTCCLLFIFFKPKLKRKKQKQKHFPYPVKIWGTCNMRESCLGPTTKKRFWGRIFKTRTYDIKTRPMAHLGRIFYSHGLKNAAQGPRVL